MSVVEETDQQEPEGERGSRAPCVLHRSLRGPLVVACAAQGVWYLELARRSGTDPSVVWRALHGERGSGLAKHDAWAAALDLTWRGTLLPADGPPMIPYMTAAPGTLNVLCVRLLAAQLEQMGLSQSEVARRANISPSAVSKLLSGRLAPVRLHDRISTALDLTWRMGLVPARDPDNLAGFVVPTPDKVDAAMRRLTTMSAVECGTPSGYTTHYSRGEKPCEACRSARAEYDRRRRSQAAKDRLLAEQGDVG